MKAKKTASQVPAKAGTTQAKGKSTAKKVNSAPLPPQPRNSSTKPLTRSQMPAPIDDTVVNDDGNGKHDATSSTPLVTDPNRVETRTGNTSQHPGQLQNAYTRKRRTKEEMIEVRRIEAEKKAQKAEEAERQAAKRKEAIRLVAEYEEQLTKMNIDYTPIAHAGRRALTAEAEATPIPPNRGLRRSYALLDVTKAGNGGKDNEAQIGGKDDDAQSTGENGEARSGGEDGEAQSRGEDDEEPPFVEESELTNQHDEDYAEEEDEDEDMLSEATGVKVVATAREKRKKDMIKEIEALDSETDEDARPKKKAKDITAAKRLIPRDEVQERTPGKTTDVRQDDGKKKAKQGVLLRGAVNTLRSEGPERNKGPVGADLPKRYVCSHLPDTVMLTLNQRFIFGTLEALIRQRMMVLLLIGPIRSRNSHLRHGPLAAAAPVPLTLAHIVLALRRPPLLVLRSQVLKRLSTFRHYPRSLTMIRTKNCRAPSLTMMKLSERNEMPLSIALRRMGRVLQTQYVFLIEYTYAKLQYVIGYCESRRRATNKNAEGPTA